jgi:hypothetical protein
LVFALKKELDLLRKQEALTGIKSETVNLGKEKKI